MKQQQRIRSGFNFFAPAYDFISFSFFGNSILKSQIHFLPELKKCKNVLIFGGGTGKLLLELAKNDIGERYSYVDISDKMIAITKSRFEKKFPSKLNTVNFICGSTTEINPEEKFDLIITPCVLDCFEGEKLSTVMSELHAHLNLGGEWLFVDFNISEKKWAQLFSRIKIRVMYFFFHVICGLGIKKLPDFKTEFEKLNYTIAKEKYFLRGLLVARVYRMVDDLN